MSLLLSLLTPVSTGGNNANYSGLGTIQYGQVFNWDDLELDGNGDPQLDGAGLFQFNSLEATPITGGSSVTYASLMGDGSVAIKVAGLSSTSLFPIIQAGIGTVAAAGAANAASSYTFRSSTGVGSGAVSVTGQQSATPYGETATGSAAVKVSGQESAQWSSLNGASIGGAKIVGQESGSFDSVAGASIGGIKVSGSSSRTFDAATQIYTGTVYWLPISGNASVVFSPGNGVAVGKAVVSGVGSTQIAIELAAGAGALKVSGAGYSALGARIDNAYCSVWSSGVSDTTFNDLMFDLSGRVFALAVSVDRTFMVRAENRVFSISAEFRMFAVKAENRKYTI